jgi:hypothetical protein
VAELLVEFSDPVVGEDGRSYTARACGSEMSDGLWQGWIEFLPRDGDEPLRSSRETTQPNRPDALYWATGLTNVYLEGALRRALNPAVKLPERAFAPPAFDEPAPALQTPDPSAPSILNPFSVSRKGEAHLRRQLSALSAWHLVNIVRNHRLSRQNESTLLATPAAQLVELIIAAVREHDRVRV